MPGCSRVFFVTGVVALMSACGNSPRNFASKAGGGTGGMSGSAGEGAEQSSSGTGGARAQGGSAGTAGSAGESQAGEAGAAGSSETPPVTADCVVAAQRSCAEAGLLGSCADGVQTCGADQHWGPCSVLPKPKDTCTTGNDDSCNGVANEDCGCVVGAERNCVGVQGNCAAGKQTCADGVWGSCSITAVAKDSCTSGDDANCNGKPNEGCSCKDGDTQACGPLAVGICKPGTSTCSGGAWGACVGAVVAAARDCRSAADNDCNGSPDNTIDSVCACHPSGQQACGAHPGLDGKGICHAGSQTCNAASNNSSSSWGSCSGSVGPSSRNCASAADNDCNGAADNTVDSVCQCGSGCPVDTVCKNLTSSSQCVACQGNADCKNGGTCNTTAGTCSCSSRFNGKTCKFLAFRGIGVLANDTDSFVNGISRDGTVVVGTTQFSSQQHAVRSVDGSPLQFIPELSSETPSAGCVAQAVDSSGRVFGYCEYGDPFQYTPATMSVAIDVTPYTFAPLSDVSQDGSVIVGFLGNPSLEAYRRTSQGTTPLGLLEPGGESHAMAVSGDGAVVVGWDSSGNNDTAWIWRSSTGMVPLPKLPGWTDYDAWDVSTDGKVVVGSASDGNCVKWTGTTLSPSIVGPGDCRATNQDGSVIVGTDSTSDIAMVWNGAAHKLSDLLGATPDLAGWTPRGAVGVSDDGKFVVGNGTNTANGFHSEGWVAHLP